MTRCGNCGCVRIRGHSGPHRAEAAIAKDIAKDWEASLCVHCNRPLVAHGGFARCAGGETQFTAKSVEGQQ